MKRALTLFLVAVLALGAEAKLRGQQQVRKETPQAELTRLGGKAFEYKFGKTARVKAEVAVKADEAHDQAVQNSRDAQELAADSAVNWKKSIQKTDIAHSGAEKSIDAAMKRYDTIQKLMESLEKQRSDVESLKAKAVASHIKAKEVTAQETEKAKRACQQATAKAEASARHAKEVAEHSSKWAMEREDRYKKRAADVKAMSMDEALARAQAAVNEYSKARADAETKEDAAAAAKAKAAAAVKASEEAIKAFKKYELAAIAARDIGGKEVELKRAEENKDHAEEQASHADKREIEADKWAAGRSHHFKYTEEKANSAKFELQKTKEKWNA